MLILVQDFCSGTHWIHGFSNYLCQQVSPHEFLQAVMKASKKRFRIGVQSEPVEFMSWLLNTLHADLRTSKKSSSIIHKCFQVLIKTLHSLFHVSAYCLSWFIVLILHFGTNRGNWRL